jgi:hypothetical protein
MCSQCVPIGSRSAARFVGVQVHTNHRERSPLSALQRLYQFQNCRREVFPVNTGTPGRNGLAARSAEGDDATESRRTSICRTSSSNHAGVRTTCETPREEQCETGRHHEKTRSPSPPCTGRLGSEGAASLQRLLETAVRRTEFGKRRRPSLPAPRLEVPRVFVLRNRERRAEVRGPRWAASGLRCLRHLLCRASGLEIAARERPLSTQCSNSGLHFLLTELDDARDLSHQCMGQHHDVR